MFYLLRKSILIGAKMLHRTCENRNSLKRGTRALCAAATRAYAHIPSGTQYSVLKNSVCVPSVYNIMGISI